MMTTMKAAFRASEPYLMMSVHLKVPSEALDGDTGTGERDKDKETLIIQTCRLSNVHHAACSD